MRGGAPKAPLSYKFGSPKNAQEKVADFFYFSQICEWGVGDYFLQSNVIWSSQERAKVVKIGLAS